MGNIKNNVHEFKVQNKKSGKQETIRYEDNKLTKNSTMDTNMITFEVYNPNDFKVYFKEYLHYDRGGLDRTFTVEAKCFCMIPHNYFLVSGENGQAGEIVKNYGDDRGKGIKTGKKI